MSLSFEQYCHRYIGLSLAMYVRLVRVMRPLHDEQDET